MIPWRLISRRNAVWEHEILAAGIYGKVKKVNEKTLEMEIAKGVVIEVSKNAVANVEK